MRAHPASPRRCAVITEFARIQLAAKGIQSEWWSGLPVGGGHTALARPRPFSP